MGHACMHSASKSWGGVKAVSSSGIEHMGVLPWPAGLGRRGGGGEVAQRCAGSARSGPGLPVGVVPQARPQGRSSAADHGPHRCAADLPAHAKYTLRSTTKFWAM